MASIVVVLPGQQEGKMIKNILIQNGFSEVFVCTSGAQTLARIDDLDAGVVISGYKLADMMYAELAENLPEEFRLLLLASDCHLAQRDEPDIMTLGLPFRAGDLVATVELMLGSVTYPKKQKKGPKGKRTPQEEALITEAKAILMNRNNMSEKEAHRYIQKCSMDTSRSFVETARMILCMR